MKQSIARKEAIMQERELIFNLKKKRPEFLEICMDLYGPTVAYIAKKILEGIGRQQDVEECVSDIFVEVWDRIEAYHTEKGNFKTWIMMIAKYKALDYRRKLLKKQSEVLNDSQVVYLKSKDNTESKILSKEKYDQMIQALKEYNDQDRKLFVQRYFYYYSIETLADEHDLSRQAVENRLYRARKYLREILEDEAYLMRKE